MSKDFKIVQEFVLSVVMDTCDPQSHLLILTNDGKLIDFNSRYENAKEHVLKIKAKDGINIAWKSFASMDEMQSFIKNHENI